MPGASERLERWGSWGAVTPCQRDRSERQEGIPVRRRSRALVLGLLAVFALAAPVHAARPTVERVPIDDHFVDDFLSDECGTEVTADVTGHAIFRIWEDADGPVRELNNFAVTLRWSSEHGSILAKDVGADRITYLDDGSLIQVVIGSVQAFSAKGIGRIYADTGRTVIHITFDENGDPVFDVLREAGQHDEDQLGAICAALGG